MDDDEINLINNAVDEQLAPWMTSSLAITDSPLFAEAAPATVQETMQREAAAYVFTGGSWPVHVGFGVPPPAGLTPSRSPEFISEHKDIAPRTKVIRTTQMQTAWLTRAGAVFGTRSLVALDFPMKNGWDIAVSPDAKWFALSTDQEGIFLWDVAAPNVALKGVIACKSAEVIAFSADSKYLFSHMPARWDRDNLVVKWRIGDGSAPVEASHVHIRTTSHSPRLTFSPDGSLLAFARSNVNNNVAVIDTATWTEDSEELPYKHNFSLEKAGGVVPHLFAFSRDNTVLAIALNQEWPEIGKPRVPSSIRIHCLKPHSAWTTVIPDLPEISIMAMSTNGSFLAVRPITDHHEQVRIYDCCTGALLRTLKGHVGQVVSISLPVCADNYNYGSSDDCLITSAWDGSLIAWNICGAARPTPANKE